MRSAGGVFFYPNCSKQDLPFQPVCSSAFVGLWQLPTYYFAGLVESNLSPVWLFLETTALSIILTWIFNSSRSLVGAIVFNGVFRTLTQFFLPFAEVTGNELVFQQLYTGVLVNMALIVLLFCGGKTLVSVTGHRKAEEAELTDRSDRMKSDIQIAQETELRPIVDVASGIGIQPQDLHLYGPYKAKVSLALMEKLSAALTGNLSWLQPSLLLQPEKEDHHNRGARDAMQRLGKRW